MDTGPGVADQRAVDVEPEDATGGVPHPFGHVLGGVHAESPLVALDRTERADQRRLVTQRSDLPVDDHPARRLLDLGAAGHVEDHVGRVDFRLGGDVAFGLGDSVVVPLQQRFGYVAHLCPDRALQEVTLGEPAGGLGGRLALAERDEQVVVVHPAHRFGGGVGRIEQAFRTPSEHRLGDAGGVVAVHCRGHQRPGDEQALGGLDVALREDEFPVDEGEFPDQPLVVDGAVGDAGVVGVPDEVVHPVHVEFARDELAELAVAGHEVGHRVGVQPVIREDAGDRPRLQQFVHVVVPLPGVAVDDGLDVVAERRVAHVVQEGGRPHPLGLLTLHVEVAQCLVGEVIDAEAVLEAGVVRGGIDQRDGAELADVSESLDQRCVQQVRRDPAHLDVVVDAVLDIHYAGLYPAATKLHASPTDAPPPEVAPFKMGADVGTDMNRYRVALLALVAAVALAGCGGLGGDSGTPTQSPANGTQANTTADTSAPYALPLNGTGIQERHRAALMDANTFVFRQSAVVRSADTGAPLQFTNVSAQVALSSGTYRLFEAATTTNPTDAYVDENGTVYLREQSDGQIGYDRQSGAENTANTYVYPDINRYLRGLDYSYDGTEQVDGETVFVYGANGTDRLDPDTHGLNLLEPSNLSAISAELRVAEDGTVRSFRYDVTGTAAEGDRIRYVVNVDYTQIGSTTVREPSWLDQAKRVTGE